MVFTIGVGRRAGSGQPRGGRQRNQPTGSALPECVRCILNQADINYFLELSPECVKFILNQLAYEEV
eukprot:SAG22_NODE_866_length_6778_cov_2.436592_3_plen_66_part_01